MFLTQKSSELFFLIYVSIICPFSFEIFLEKTGLRIWWSCSHSEWDASIWRLLRRSPYPSLHLSQCYWHPRKQLASTSHICSHSLMNLGESLGFLKFFLGQYGKYSGWTEIFISFAMVRYSPKSAFEAFGFPWEAANRLFRNLLPVIGNKFLTNSFSSAFQ